MGNRSDQFMRSFTGVVLASCTLLAACSSNPEPTEVVISLAQTAQSLSSATILVDYSRSHATPLVRDGAPACTSILPHVDAEFTDDGAGGLTIKARSAQGFSAPVDLAACRMVGDAGAAVTPASISAGLHISVLGATGSDGQRLDDKRLAQSRAAGRHVAVASRAEPLERRSADGDGHRTGGADGHDPAMLARRDPATGRPIVDPQPQGRDRDDAASSVTRTHQQPSSRRPSDEVLDELDDQVAALGRGGGGDGNSPGEAGADDTSNDESDDDARAVEYAVVLGVTTESGVLGALQFDIRHTGVSGGWLGAGASAACTADVQVALATFNDRKGGFLSGALVDLSGIDTPGRIATCTFKSRDAVDAGSFSVQVVDASSTNPQDPPPAPFPEMTVFDVVRRN